jgi:murein DD-endopeptidase MepM/ murein hydrolase activator NlpD
MLGPTYRYNEKTCRYERSSVSIGSAIFYIFGLLIVSVCFLTGFLLLHDFMVDTEAEVAFKKENAILDKHKRILGDQLESVEIKLASLKEKDQVLHQKFFSSILPAEKVTSSRNAKTDILLADANDFRKTVDQFKSESNKLIRASSESSAAFADIIRIEDHLALIPSLPLISPLKEFDPNNLLSGFGTRINPFHKGLYNHEGIDIAAARGTEVLATAKGTVVIVRSSALLAGYGNYIEIDHGNGFTTRYAHLESLNVRHGQHVSKGAVIGSSGTSGGSVAPHLHYEILRNGQNVDPVDYLISGLNADTHTALKKISQNVNQSLD